MTTTKTEQKAPIKPHSQTELRKRRRERIAIVVLSVFFVVLSIAEFKFTQVSSTLPFVNSIFFFGLLNINVLILIAVFWLIFKNIGKIFFERRSRILGARLKTKLVVAFLAFSITPTVVLFIISSLYINSSFDKWFSIKVQNTLQASLDITRAYYDAADKTAHHFASHISNQLQTKLPTTVNADVPIQVPDWVSQYLDEQRGLLALDAVEFYSDILQPRILKRDLENDQIPGLIPRLSFETLNKAFSGKNLSLVQHLRKGDLIRRVVPVHSSNAIEGSKIKSVVGILVVDSYIPVSLINKVDEISSVFEDYKDTNPLKYPIKTAYFLILIMVTLMMIFVGIWLGLYLAKELTVPVERLVKGARLVGSGNLDVTIESTGHDEIAVLVESFNNMIGDLKENRVSLTNASQALETRTLELEAVLANIGTGVIVVDQGKTISTFNRAASQLIDIQPENTIGRHYKNVLTGEAKTLVELIDRAFETSEDPSPTVKPPPAEVIQWTYNSKNESRSLAGIATMLKDGQKNWGVVLVIDDMTHIMKAQREVAWREVARRIAHEIKNPLTPIKLSAQRLQRRLGHYGGKDGTIVQECTETIVRHTDELKEMVNEFSNFARLPEISPTVSDINGVIDEAISLYGQAHPEIKFQANLESKIPAFEFDRDQIKRVIINLFENSVSALKGAQVSSPEIQVKTHFNEKLKITAISIQDNGPGMAEDIRSRVFEPYFSTKKEGTGLGLAIAKRIINDHDGFIRINATPNSGTQFLIELPTTSGREINRTGIKTREV